MQGRDISNASKDALTAFTIGHSNHPIAIFINLLKLHNIDVLVDTRSYPFSKYAPQFNQDNLQRDLKEAGRKYCYTGHKLGGRPKDPQFYDDEGYVLYSRIAASPDFQQEIRRLLNDMAKYRIALLCSEEDPYNCHRRLLIGRVLDEYGVNVCHIRGTGKIQTEAGLRLHHKMCDQQLSIFSSEGENQQWKSTQSVLRKRPLLSSSNVSNEQV